MKNLAAVFLFLSFYVYSDSAFQKPCKIKEFYGVNNWIDFAIEDSERIELLSDVEECYNLAISVSESSNRSFWRNSVYVQRNIFGNVVNRMKGFHYVRWTFGDSLLFNNSVGYVTRYTRYCLDGETPVREDLLFDQDCTSLNDY